MKKTIILLGLALGVTHFASAQKGSVLLFGNIGYDETSAHNDPSTSNTGSEKSNQFSVSPGIGYQFSDHWAAGITLSYYHQGNSQTGTTGTYKTDVDTYSIGAFLRYYHPLTSWVYFYAQFDAVYAPGPRNYDYSAAGNATRNYTFDAYPALYFPIKNGFGLNASLGGIYYTHNNIVGLSSSGGSFSVNFGSAALIGISKNFGGHKAAAKS